MVHISPLVQIGCLTSRFEMWASVFEFGPHADPIRRGTQRPGILTQRKCSQLLLRRLLRRRRNPLRLIITQQGSSRALFATFERLGETCSLKGKQVGIPSDLAPCFLDLPCYLHRARWPFHTSQETGSGSIEGVLSRRNERVILFRFWAPNSRFALLCKLSQSRTMSEI